MNIFSAPQWDIDEASERLSKNVLGDTASGKKKKRKDKGEKNELKSNGDDSPKKKTITPASCKKKKRKEKVGKNLLKRNGDDSPEKKTSTPVSRGASPSVAPQSILKMWSPKTKKGADNPVFDGKDVKGSPTKDGEVISKRQKKRLKEKRKKINKLRMGSVNQEISKSGNEKGDNDTSPSSNTKKKRKIKSSSKDNVDIPGNASVVQSKIQKLLDVRKKKKKAHLSKNIIGNGINIAQSLDNSSSRLQSDLDGANSKKLKLLLRKKLKKQKKKEAMLQKKELQEATSPNVSVKVKIANEIVLSKKREKKMRQIAKGVSSEKINKPTKGIDNLGTANPSFDTSATDSLDPTKENKISKKKRKMMMKKKQQLSTSQTDVVDGNLMSSSSTFNVNSNKKKTKLKQKTVASVPESDDIGPKSKKKKMVVAKLLEEAQIVEKTTLQDLKKKRLLERDSTVDGAGSSKKKTKTPLTLREKVAQQLKSSRFRWLNEQLYTTNSWEAMKYFKEDPEAYEAYHSGYRNQVSQWPVNPIDIIIQTISSLPNKTVVADFGCGDAKLAESLRDYTVHSIDLVASKPGIIACDMAHTPLLMESVDVAVFCLSLMGTNLNDFILEANRVLRNGGILLIAEVESRFEDIDNFTSAMVHFGFHLKKKDLSNQMFIFMDFKKTMKVSKTGKLPTLSLEPCVYKKR